MSLLQKNLVLKILFVWLDFINVINCFNKLIIIADLHVQKIH